MTADMDSDLEEETVGLVVRDCFPSLPFNANLSSTEPLKVEVTHAASARTTHLWDTPACVHTEKGSLQHSFSTVVRPCKPISSPISQ